MYSDLMRSLKQNKLWNDELRSSYITFKIKVEGSRPTL